jgi:bacteriocin-like protein
MNTIINHKFKELSPKQLNEVKGGFYVILRLPDGTKVKVWV